MARKRVSYTEKQVTLRTSENALMVLLLPTSIGAASSSEQRASDSGGAWNLAPHSAGPSGVTECLARAPPWAEDGTGVYFNTGDLWLRGSCSSVMHEPTSSRVCEDDHVAEK